MAGKSSTASPPLEGITTPLSAPHATKREVPPHGPFLVLSSARSMSNAPSCWILMSALMAS